MVTPSRQAAYTLLELLVVLLLLALVAALAAPRVTTLYNSLDAAYSRDEALARLGQLSYQVFRTGRELELRAYPASPGQELPLELPAGWSLQTEPPIRYQANGACAGGEVLLRHADRAYRVRLRAPFCQPNLI